MLLDGGVDPAGAALIAAELVAAAGRSASAPEPPLRVHPVAAMTTNSTPSERWRMMSDAITLLRSHRSSVIAPMYPASMSRGTTGRGAALLVAGIASLAAWACGGDDTSTGDSQGADAAATADGSFVDAATGSDGAREDSTVGADAADPLDAATPDASDDAASDDGASVDSSFDGGADAVIDDATTSDAAD